MNKITTTQADAQAISHIVAVLGQHPDIRILRRIPFMPEMPGEPTAEDRATWKKALIVDTETTSLDTALAKVLELGVAEIWFRPDGSIAKFGRCDSWFQDPGEPIPAEITAVNGITDEMVHGQQIPEAEVDSYFEGALLIIAHNAAYDRPICERRLPRWFNMNQYWACSVEDVEWKRLTGFPSNALTVIAWASGVFFHAHRAKEDCAALAYLLAMLVIGAARKSPLMILVEAARKKTHRINVEGSDFHKKDLLKARGYRWNGAKKVWHTDIATADEIKIAEERAWVRNTILMGKDPGGIDYDGRDRYSGRV